MKPRLLFISPAAPVPTGHGLGMRAWASLRALARAYDVHLLVLNHPPADPATAAALAGFCREVAFVPAGLWDRRHALLRRLAALSPAFSLRLFPHPPEWACVQYARTPFPFAERAFDTAFVFRLYAAPALDHLRTTASWKETWLDADDLESLTRRRLAGLHRSNGRRAQASLLNIEADQYGVIERDMLRRFDRLFVCSAADRERLLESGLHPAPEVLPNVVDAPPLPAPAPHSGPVFLFVGNLGYLPNEDAVIHFCRHILPAIRRRGAPDTAFHIAGGGATRELIRESARHPGVVLLGRVPDLAPVYACADIVVAPLRAGGGTRIKILEAFARGRPVVATPEAIEGIAAIHETHALIADTPDAFARSCLQLVREPTLGAALIARAAELVRTAYSPGAIEAVLSAGRLP